MWQERWKRAAEKTSSLESTLHFGHYILGAYSDHISHLHVTLSSIALRRGFAYNHWSQGLLVMLEKEMGNKLINKLRAILLMEAVFNFGNKQTYGIHMLSNARKDGHMPDEIFSEKIRMADNRTLS